MQLWVNLGYGEGSILKVEGRVEQGGQILDTMMLN